ncbi:asparaginase [candidate division KSB1 bacterium]
MKEQISILVIYTGGTIGMIKDPESGTLLPFDFETITSLIPEIKTLGYQIDSWSFDPLIDSSNVSPAVWIELSHVIGKNYDKYDGFVVLHGSDTMAFSSAALSFILDNLNKPVVFTGSQLPMGVSRTDGRENFITSIEIAASKRGNKPMVPEVSLYFEYQLYRGNRVHKFSAENFEAFRSINYPVLAEAGVNIKFNTNAIRKADELPLKIHECLDTNVAILKLFPGISPQVVNSILNTKGLKGVILETYGSGNAHTDKWFLDTLKRAIDKNIIIFNVTQCRGGAVEMHKYHTGKELEKLGVIGGHDMITESAIAKLMYLLGCGYKVEKVKRLLQENLRGELTL